MLGEINTLLPQANINSQHLFATSGQLVAELEAAPTFSTTTSFEKREDADTFANQFTLARGPEEGRAESSEYEPNRLVEDKVAEFVDRTQERQVDEFAKPPNVVVAPTPAERRDAADERLRALKIQLQTNEDRARVALQQSQAQARERQQQRRLLSIVEQGDANFSSQQALNRKPGQTINSAIRGDSIAAGKVSIAPEEFIEEALALRAEPLKQIERVAAQNEREMRLFLRAIAEQVLEVQTAKDKAVIAEYQELQERTKADRELAFDVSYNKELRGTANIGKYLARKNQSHGNDPSLYSATPLEMSLQTLDYLITKQRTEPEPQVDRFA